MSNVRLYAAQVASAITLGSINVIPPLPRERYVRHP